MLNTHNESADNHTYNNDSLIHEERLPTHRPVYLVDHVVDFATSDLGWTIVWRERRCTSSIQ